MKRMFTLMIILAIIINANCQNNKKLSDYFPDIQDENAIMKTGNLWKLNSNNPLDTTIALKYFFDNDTKKMHDVYQAYNMDDNTYTDVHYIREIYPLYKIKNKEIYLLCYKLESVTDLMLYDRKNDIIISTFTIGDNSDEYGNTYTYSVILPNNYIATIKFYDQVYYILYKIDYEAKKFVELKKTEINPTDQNDNTIRTNLFYALGISETGELLESNQ
jgi:hypothetical protein